MNQPLKRKRGIFLQLPVRRSCHERHFALILLDTEHPHRDGAMLQRSLAELAPKPERVTEAQSSSQQSPAPATVPTLTPMYQESYSKLRWADSACASFPLVVSGQEEGLSFMGKQRKVTEGLTPLGLLPSCNLGFSPREKLIPHLTHTPILQNTSRFESEVLLCEWKGK